jgi:hypothetical protein
MENTIQATVYKRPHGGRSEITVRKINPEAAQYINDNNVRVSFEDIGFDTAVYFDAGFVLDDDETPDEIILMAGKRTCQEVMDKAVDMIKSRKSATQPVGE